jgi:hypothetical protein
MSNWGLTAQDIEQLIQNFNRQPTRELYTEILNWYEEMLRTDYDQEYLTCVYLFLLGANIKQGYQEISKDQHMTQVREIRELVQDAPPLAKTKRKLFLDFGTKAGFGMF